MCFFNAAPAARAPTPSAIAAAPTLVVALSECGPVNASAPLLVGVLLVVAAVVAAVDDDADELLAAVVVAAVLDAAVLEAAVLSARTGLTPATAAHAARMTNPLRCNISTPSHEGIERLPAASPAGILR